MIYFFFILEIARKVRVLRGAPYGFDAIGGVYDPVGLWCSVSTVVIGGVCGLGWSLNGLGVN